MLFVQRAIKYVDFIYPNLITAQVEVLIANIIGWNYYPLPYHTLPWHSYNLQLYLSRQFAVVSSMLWYNSGQFCVCMCVFEIVIAIYVSCVSVIIAAETCIVCSYAQYFSSFVINQLKWQPSCFRCMETFILYLRVQGYLGTSYRPQAVK